MATQIVLRDERRTVEGLAYAVAPGVPDKLIILDVAEGGMAVQACEPLLPETILRLEFELPNNTSPLHATGEVVWADRGGRAGIRFVRLPDTVRVPLRKWLASPQPAQEPQVAAEAQPQQVLEHWAVAAAIDALIVFAAVGLFGASAYLLADALPPFEKLAGTALLLLAVCGSVYRIVFFPRAERRPGRLLAHWTKRMLEG